MTTYGVLRQLPTVMSPYGSAKPSSAVAYALFTTSMLVRVLYERAEVSNALTRARSARTCSAIRCFPNSERSASCERSAARAPVAMPNDVALSGNRASRCSAHSSSSAIASLSMVPDEPELPSRAQAESNGRTALDASAARTSRRVTIIGNRELGIGNRKACLRLSGGVRDRQRFKGSSQQTLEERSRYGGFL